MSFFTSRLGPAIYDFLGKRAEPELAVFRRAVISHARGRVLEIGAGTGFNLAHYPPEVKEIVITEPAKGMLERAERRAAELDRPVQSVEAAAEQLPFEDASFDAVVSTLVLCSVENQGRALAEIHRVLKPGGKLLFVEHVRSDDPRLARWQDRFERPWGAIGMGCHPNRATLEQIEASGFEVEQVEHGKLPKAPPIVRPLIFGRALRVPEADVGE